jgi:carbon-monoxide dehydrogenase medium subunit
MKPAPFEYIRAESVLQAQEWLAADPEARVIAGGQTLMPMLAMRLVRPTRVIDIAGIAGLDGIEVTADHVTLGAMVRQVAVERSAAVAQALPLLAKAIRFVGHPPTRRRGTIGGSVANADPAAEIALVAVTLGAEVLTTADAFAARDFFLAPMTTALPAGAMVTGLRFPRVTATRRGTGFAEVAMRQGDYAMAAAACELVLGAGGEVVSLRLGIGGATPVPVLLEVREPTRDAIAAALAPLEMMHDPNAGAGYRRRAALALAMQAVAEAQREVAA